MLSILISAGALLVSIISAYYTYNQYKSSIKPELHSNSYSVDPNQNQFKFDIINNGQAARIIKIKVKSKNLKPVSNPTPYYLQKGESLYLYFDYTGNLSIKNDIFKIKIIYSDKDKNQHSSTFKKVNGKYCII